MKFIQEDLDGLFELSKTWLLKFHPDNEKFYQLAEGTF